MCHNGCTVSVKCFDKKRFNISELVQDAKVAHAALLGELGRGTRGQGGAVETHLPPTSEVGSSNPEPYVKNILLSYRWSAVYRTEP